MPLEYDSVNIALGARVMAVASSRPGQWSLHAFDGEDRGRRVGFASRVNLWNCKFFVWRTGPENELLAGVVGALTGFSDLITPSLEFYFVVVWDSEKELFVRAHGGMDVDQVNDVLLWDDGLIYAGRTPDTPFRPDFNAEQEINEAFAVTCPECGAEPGVRCPGRPRSGLHTSRLAMSPTLRARTEHTTRGDSP